MKYDDILTKVCNRVTETFPDKTITGATKFENLGADSLDIFEIVMDLENICNVHISDAEWNFVRYKANLSVSDIANTIFYKLNSQSVKNNNPVLPKQNDPKDTTEQTLDKNLANIDKTLAKFWQDSAMRDKILNKRIRHIR